MYIFTVIHDWYDYNGIMMTTGHKQLDKGKLAPYLWREDYCGACGTQHSNPHLLDTYYTCEVNRLFLFVDMCA